MNNSFEELEMLLQKCNRMGISTEVTLAGQLLISRLERKGKILTAGNGGSACDAAHLAEELLGKYSKARRPLPAINLNACTATLTCIANDFGFEDVFARQIRALGDDDDALVVFSTSGNSPNVLAALRAARDVGMWSVLLTGQDGGKGRFLADATICVPSTNTARIQEIHTLILHTWLEQIENHDL